MGSAVCYSLMEMPFLAIHESSEAPTPEEILIIGEIRKTIARKFGAQEDALCGESANMVTIAKIDGRWTFRHMTWQVGPTWHPTTQTLEDIQNAL